MAEQLLLFQNFSNNICWRTAWVFEKQSFFMRFYRFWL